MSRRHLPPEICAQILAKLPVKSVVRFRCVCKTWYSLISCPNFISDHTAQFQNQTTGDRLLVHRRGDGGSTFSSHDKSFLESHEHHELPRAPDFEIVGSCHGLICLCKRKCTTQSFLIWNPSLRKLVELPFSYSPFCQGLRCLFGFGFDSKTRDYKVLRVVCHKTYGSSDEVLARSDIFDLKKFVWRSSSSLMRPCYFKQPCVYLNGNLHWIGFDDTSNNYILLSFNLSSEVLHDMEMVPDEDEDDDCILAFAEVMPIDGLLSLAVVKGKEQGDVHQYCISVWSMKEYGVTESWTKLFNIDYSMDLISLQRFWENGEVLLVERVVGNKDGGNVLVLYNPENRKSKALLSTDEHFHSVCSFKESLVLL